MVPLLYHNLLDLYIFLEKYLSTLVKVAEIKMLKLNEFKIKRNSYFPSKKA